jgi:predicted RNA-binding Zn ribbon-like protein
MRFEFVAGNLALDFANTVHSHGFSDPQDDLKTYADLIGWSRQAGLLSHRQRRQLERRKSAQEKADFERTQDLRESIYGIFSSIARGKRASPEAVREFNLHLRQVMAEASLESVGRRFALTWDARGTAWRRGSGRNHARRSHPADLGPVRPGSAMRRRNLQLALPGHKP